MQLKKILEEIDAHAIEFEIFGTSDDYISVGWVKDIIRKHLSRENSTEIKRSSRDNDGWIPVEERLPEISRTPEEDDECPEFNVTIRGAEEATTLKYSSADGTWFDDNGYVYDVIAWRPLPEPYRPEPETEKPYWRQDMLRKFDRRSRQ